MMHFFPCSGPESDDSLGEGPITMHYTIPGDRDGGWVTEIAQIID